MLPPETSAAARLCAACGLCCNGVMFHTVRMQPGDSPHELAALGLKLKRKRGEQYILQPCPAHRDSCCSIYAARPERCRRFECRQLRRTTAGEITEAAAFDRIREAQRLVAAIEKLLAQAGSTNPKHPLSKRCEKAFAEPLDASSDPSALDSRRLLTQTMADLETLLDAHFRNVPITPRCDVLDATV